MVRPASREICPPQRTQIAVGGAKSPGAAPGPKRYVCTVTATMRGRACTCIRFLDVDGTSCEQRFASCPTHAVGVTLRLPA